MNYLYLSKNEKLPAGYEMEKMPVIYPHDLIGYLFNTLGVTISREAVTRYWVHALSTGQPFALYGPGDTDGSASGPLWGRGQAGYTVQTREADSCMDKPAAI